MKLHDDDEAGSRSLFELFNGQLNDFHDFLYVFHDILHYELALIEINAIDILKHHTQRIPCIRHLLFRAHDAPGKRYRARETRERLVVGVGNQLNGVGDGPEQSGKTRKKI